MGLAAGTTLGPYEVVAPLGAGGMGEVYRARDSRLGREVAVKVLPASASTDPERLKRFEQEARATGLLNHPNILTVYDTGVHNGAPYVVSELLEGETLRERVRGGALSPRKAIEIARQIAQGLAAAHEKGIVHRDLKPENLFITRDSRVKILDFGLAKLTAEAGLKSSGSASLLQQETAAMTVDAPLTSPGVALGTVGYMSPEQVRGEAADHRADIFAFGAILYEMLAGGRAFQKDSSVETMAAILKEEPPDLTLKNPDLPPALERVVRHCLEKHPEDRFQSARDLAFNLDTVSNLSGPSSAALRARLERPSRRKMAVGLAAALLLAGVLAGAFVAGMRKGRGPAPVFHQLTYRRGSINMARFAPDGQTVVYDAAWDGEPVRLFSMQAESPESRAQDLPPSGLLSISKSGDMAISLGQRPMGGFTSLGTMARAPLGGGAARELLENVEWADWLPDGAELVIVRTVEGLNRLELPAGKVLYQTSGWISHPRVSPRGEWVAFLDHPARGDDAGLVAVVDRQGDKKVLTGSYSTAEGLAWSPSGEEVWYTAAKEGSARALRAVDRKGRERVVLRVPGSLTLLDIASDRRVLLKQDTSRVGIVVRPPGEDKDRDLSWFDWSLLRDLSSDGKKILFDETGEAGGSKLGVFLRPTDGSPAIRLGDGVGMGLSPDGKWALSLSPQSRDLVLLPTGPGGPRTLERGTLGQYHWVSWFPDGRRVLIYGNETSRPPRLYVQDIEVGSPKAITPEGVGLGFGGSIISPDGQWIAAPDVEQMLSLYPVTGEGKPRRVPGTQPREWVARWSGDGRMLYVGSRGRIPLSIFKVEVATGRRQLWREVAPPDPAGLAALMAFHVTPDEKAYAYSYARILSELYLVEGLK